MRTGLVVARRAGRSIDKALKCIHVTFTGTTQIQTAILGALARAVTVTGLRWSLSHTGVIGAASAIDYWAIVYYREGQAATVPNMSTTHNAALYQPEQDVLACGAFNTLNTNTGSVLHTGQTKTMRKMKTGDQLMLIIQSTAATTSILGGVIQFFLKE